MAQDKRFILASAQTTDYVGVPDATTGTDGIKTFRGGGNILGRWLYITARAVQTLKDKAPAWPHNR